MEISIREVELTGRIEKLTLLAESFNDERIVSAIAAVFRDGGSIQVDPLIGKSQIISYPGAADLKGD